MVSPAGSQVQWVWLNAPLLCVFNWEWITIRYAEKLIWTNNQDVCYIAWVSALQGCPLTNYEILVGVKVG